MAGETMFTNDTPHDLIVKVSVLQSGDAREVETLDFPLPAGAAQWVRYSNDAETRLNGVRAKAMLPDGAEVRLNHVVREGISAEDDVLNSNDTINFALEGSELRMAAAPPTQPEPAAETKPKSTAKSKAKPKKTKG